MAQPNELDYPYEASDEASENELLDRSLSVWKGWSGVPNEEFEPIPLDLHTGCSIGHYDCVRAILDRYDEHIVYMIYIFNDTIVVFKFMSGIS